MRVIDADALEKSLENSCGTESMSRAFVEFLNYVDEIPTIDAVPVVRCYECKNHCDTNGKHYCKFWRMYCPDDSDFFCKAGKRKEGAE